MKKYVGSLLKFLLPKHVYAFIHTAFRLARLYPEMVKTSHVPPCDRKSALRMIVDMLCLGTRFRWLSVQFYYTLKMDRKGCELRNHVTEGEFASLRDWVNERYPAPGLSYAGITRDKVLSKSLLSSLGAYVPMQRASVSLSQSGVPVFVGTDGEQCDIRDLKGPMCYKPVEAECGQGVIMFEIKDDEHAVMDDEPVSLTALIDAIAEQIRHWGHGMVEDRIVQHTDLNILYPQSVNSMRIITVTKPDGSIMTMGAFLRIGAHGRKIDNYATGGVIVNCDKDGHLEEIGYSRPEYGNFESDRHPDTGVIYKGYKVPYFREAVDECVRLHQILTGIYSIGWDVAVTPKGPMIVEMNDNWELQPLEHCSGRGLRSEYEETFVAVAKKLGKH